MKFQCNIEPNQTQYSTNQIQWEFSKDNLTFTKLPVGVQIVSDDQIFIDKINKKAHRGYYRCSLNNISFTIFLRVKGLFTLFMGFCFRKLFVYIY